MGGGCPSLLRATPLLEIEAFPPRAGLARPALPGLYRVRADAVPAGDAPTPPVDTLGMPGGASPLGGTVAEFGSFDLNRNDQLAVVVDLVGASARSALLLVDAGSAIVP